MDSEFQTKNEDNPLNKKWENIKSAIKNVSDRLILRKQLKLQRNEENTKTKTLKKDNKDIALRNQVNRETKKSKE